MKNSKLHDRAHAALMWMRNGSSLHDAHSTANLRKAMGIDSTAACSAAMEELRKRFLVERSGRSAWRLTELGRDAAITFALAARQPKSGNFDADFDRRAATLGIPGASFPRAALTIEHDSTAAERRSSCAIVLERAAQERSSEVEVKLTSRDGKSCRFVHVACSAGIDGLLSVIEGEWMKEEGQAAEPPIAAQAAAALAHLRADGHAGEFRNSFLRNRAGDAGTPSQLSSVLRYLEAHGLVENVRRGVWKLTKAGADPMGPGVERGPRNFKF